LPSRPSEQPLWLAPGSRAQELQAKLPDGDSISFDDFGVRSRVDSLGKVLGAPLGVPERLVAVHELGARFIGIAPSGRIYVAEDALAPWILKSIPSVPFVSVAFGLDEAKPLLLGLRADGSLHLSGDLGQSWKLWPSQYFFSRVYADKAGRFLLQTLPEAWFQFRAQGELEPVSGTMGGARQARVSSHGLVVEGAHSSWVWAGKAALSPFAATPESDPLLSLGREPARFATAGDLGPLGALDSVSGRVFILEPRSAKKWQALTGSMTEPLRAHDLELDPSCVPKRVAIYNQTILVLCSPSKRVLVPSFSLYASSDGGQKFHELVAPLLGEESALRVVAGPSGTFALSGICPQREAERGCAAHGLWAGSVSAQPALAVPLVQIPLPEDGLPLDFAMASDGAVFALYQHEADNRLWLYRAPPTVGAAPDKRQGGVPRGLDLTRHFRMEAVPAVRSRLFASGEPLMGLSLELGERHTVMAFDSELEVWGFGELPAGAKEVGISGRNIFGLDSESGSYWQSDDAGLSFGLHPLPAVVSLQKGRPAIACSERGCLLGQDLILSGWGGQERGKSPVKAGPQPSARQFMAVECRRRNSPSETLVGLSSLPTAHDAVRGEVAWSQVAVDPKRAQVSVLHARYGQEHIERHELFSPSLEPERVALFVSEQIEGSAALRYRLPGTPGSAIEQLELAWDNRIEGILRRELLTLPELGPEARKVQFALRSGDFEYSPHGAVEAKPWLLSVSGQVIYLGLHARPDAQDEVIVAGDKAGGRLLKVPESVGPALAARVPVEIVGSLGRDAFFVLEEGSRLVRFPRPDGGLSDLRLAPAQGQAHLLSSAAIAYRGSVPQFSAMIADEEGTFLQAYQVSVRDAASDQTANSLRVPVFADLGDSPRPCSIEERKTGPRTIAIAFPEPASRIKIEISPRVWQEFSLVRAVVQGTLESPCVSMLEAEGPNASGTRALIDLQEGAVSWHFQAPRSGDPGALASVLECSLGPPLTKNQNKSPR